MGRGGRGSAPRPDPGLEGGSALNLGLHLRTGERCSPRCISSILRPKQGSSRKPRLSGEGLTSGACVRRGGRALDHPVGSNTAPGLCIQGCPSVFQVMDSVGGSLLSFSMN